MSRWSADDPDTAGPSPEHAPETQLVALLVEADGLLKLKAGMW